MLGSLLAASVPDGPSTTAGHLYQLSSGGAGAIRSARKVGISMMYGLAGRRNPEVPILVHERDCGNLVPRRIHGLHQSIGLGRHLGILRGESRSRATRPAPGGCCERLSHRPLRRPSSRPNPAARRGSPVHPSFTRMLVTAAVSARSTTLLRQSKSDRAAAERRSPFDQAHHVGVRQPGVRGPEAIAGLAQEHRGRRRRRSGPRRCRQ